jgi:hypothetical protein
MVEPPGGIVVTRRITSSDIEGHVQTTCDFVENLTLELGVRGRWLLSVQKLMPYSNDEFSAIM